MLILGEQRKTGRGDEIMPEPDTENVGRFSPEHERQARKKQYIKALGGIERKLTSLDRV